MPKVHFVKKALKDNPVAKKGESYYWWKPMVGGRGGKKRYSKQRPKPSQVTQSEFLSAVYALREEMEDFKPAELDDLKSAVEGWAEQAREIGSECEDKFNNMPEGFQQGESGQLLEERASAMEQWASDLESLDLDPDEEDEKDLESFLAEKLDEVLELDPGV